MPRDATRHRPITREEVEDLLEDKLAQFDHLALADTFDQDVEDSVARHLHIEIAALRSYLARL